MYNELIDALRNCADPKHYCTDCKYDKNGSNCVYLLRDAADAIERLQAENDELRAEKANQMTNIQAACVLLIHELYKTEPVGGDLHIVVDDCNVTNENLAWCEHYIREKHDVITQTVLLEFTILGLLALMTEPEREECVNKA